SGMGAGAYDVTPSKVGGISPGGMTITGNDSALIAQHVVALTTLNATQLTVADVSGASGVTSFDAALIARWVVALSGSGTTGNWIFDPTSRNYADVNADIAGEDYSALLMGDVTGNWDQNLVSPRPAPLDEVDGGLAVIAPKVKAGSGSSITIPVSIGETTDRGIVAYQFDLRYDPAVLEPAAGAAALAGTVSDGMSVTVNALDPGSLRVVVFGAEALAGSGRLIDLRFNVVGSVGSGTDLTWNNFIINEGGVDFSVGHGRLEVAASERASISGRVLTGMGRGIGSARVTVVDNAGNQRSVMTSSFGYFEINDLEMGETYIVSVSSRRYRFAPQTVSLSGSAISLDIIAQE
ncbi:MAG: cohesin domain-containing protein, partial [Pyrinomonadaceae bacterium]